MDIPWKYFPESKDQILGVKNVWIKGKNGGNLQENSVHFLGGFCNSLRGIFILPCAMFPGKILLWEKKPHPWKTATINLPGKTPVNEQEISGLLCGYSMEILGVKKFPEFYNFRVD